MRLIIATLLIVFAISIMIVVVANASTHVSVTLWPDAPEYTYHDIPVAAVIFFSALYGTLLMGIIAVLEGSKTWFENARLRARVRRLEQEIETMRRPPLDTAASAPPIAEPPAAEIDVAGSNGAL